MKIIVITQRVAVIPHYGERRDCLDQAWARFAGECGLLPLAMPNVPAVALSLFQNAEVAGLLLTGGNDLVSLGGDAPERDVTENALMDAAESRRIPILGVCRGMQVIQQRHSVPLVRVEGHVTPSQIIQINSEPMEVNSYHHFAAHESRPPLEVWAVAADGVVKAVRHSSRPITGIMWHPERNTPFSGSDIALFRRVFKVG
jgi:gamma-glutamyl-gamma-aminobutyrate hydrolase PuuD